MVNYITTNTFPIVLDLSCPCLFSCACKRPQREQLQQHLELLELRLGPFKWEGVQESSQSMQRIPQIHSKPKEEPPEPQYEY